MIPSTISTNPEDPLPQDPIERLRERYPQTIAAFEQMKALDHLQTIARLDGVWDSLRRDPHHALPQKSVYTPLESPVLGKPTFDLMYAGAGLGLIHAALMAQNYGYKVLLFDRGEVGCAHREWNISRAELGRLVASGFCSWEELQPVVMNEYQRGVVRFFQANQEPSELWMRGVLDVALDANALMRLARRKLEQAGGVILDERKFAHVRVASSGPLWVELTLETADGTAEHYTGRLLLDSMGSSSPLAIERFGGLPFAGVCPTVGTVARGFKEGPDPQQHDPKLGDILVSVDDAQSGQQYLWEGFPGRDDQMTVYLFYYDTLAHAPKTKLDRLDSNLMDLFEVYFAQLPSYKQLGPDFEHLKPVYGYIPARHSVLRQESPLLRGVLPIGDSAAQQSPLTFCGFGAHIRNLDRTTSLLHKAIQRKLLDPEHLRWVSSYQVNVSLNWVFSRFMQPWDNANDVNHLQHLFLSSLKARGEVFARRFFRDQMWWSDYHKILFDILFVYPQILLLAFRVLGVAGLLQWARDYLQFSLVGASAALGRKFGPRGRWALLRMAWQARPSLGWRLEAWFAEWEVMGWLEFDRDTR